MRISDLLTVCLRNLTRRKVRTALTVIGVVIGVCAIILMVSLGIGARESMMQMLQEWGDLTIINVYNYGGGETKLDDTAVSQIQAMEGVQSATPFYQNYELNFRLKSRNGRYDSYTQIIGIYPEAFEALGYQLSEGTSFADSNKDYSMVAGANVAYSFRDTKKNRNNYVDRYQTDAMGNPKKPFVDMMKDKLILYSEIYDNNGNLSKTLEVTPHITGIMVEDWNKGWETSECIFMDINQMKALEAQYRKLSGQKASSTAVSYEDVRVKCVDAASVSGIQQAITDMGFQCSSMEDTRQYFDEQLTMIQTMLGGLAAISLFVAAIGIANTMVMSIYERTKEIGVMKVIGAELGSIRAMFLTESAMIGLIGGVVGVTLSFLISYLLNNVPLVAGLLASLGLSFGGGGAVSIIPWWLVVLAMAFSMLVGVIFGFIPANRAVKISALEAIRHD